MIGLEGQWLSVRDPLPGGVLSLFCQYGEHVVLGNHGNVHTKHIAVHNGSTEVRPDVYEDAKLIGGTSRGKRPEISIFRMAKRAEGAFRISFCFVRVFRHLVVLQILPLLPARHESSWNLEGNRKYRRLA